MIGSKIVEVMMHNAERSAMSGAVTLMWAEVTEINPLKIKVEDRFEVKEEMIALSALCRETVIEIPFPSVEDGEDDDVEHIHKIPRHYTNYAGDPSHRHEIAEFETEKALPKIRLWRGLKVGDKVRVLRVGGGQLFYILEREEGVIEDDSSEDS